MKNETETSGAVTPGLSFLYDGVPFADLEKQVETLPDGVRYTLPDGLVVSSILRFFPDERVYWWVNRWENPTDHDSGLVTELWDCDVTVPFAPDVRPSRRDRQDTWEPKSFRVYETKGANVTQDDYSASYRRLWDGDTFRTSCQAGRSGYDKAPFLDINRNECGVLLAVGWTGQWCAEVQRTADAARIKSGIQYAQKGFRMRPGERFRTSSAAVMYYANGQDEAHNRWRRFMRKISPVGPGKARGEQCPFSAIFWGGIPSDRLIGRWSSIFEAGFPFDTCWIDAGWYEPLRSMTTASQTADWPNVGRWEVNRSYHPAGYRDVVDYLHAHGVGFMVWFEPERIHTTVGRWTKSLDAGKPEAIDQLTALNEDEVCDAVIGMVSDKVKELSLSVYRQDCNIAPLSFWVHNDEPERSGVTEIKYINNLYRFWDTLLERFPSLLIDNCAGGGHRNDIEMLSRAVPLWRSDYQCTWDCCPEANQMQNQAAAWWIPYAGIGYGPTLGDTYSFRSAYCNGMTVRTWEHVDPEWEFGASGEPVEWAKKYFAEYNGIRRYFAQDYYPLVPFSRENGSWCASQYHDPDTQSGVILAFRRAACPFDSVTVKLSGLDAARTYTFTDADTGAVFSASGRELMSGGLRLTIAETRGSLLLKYE